MNWEEREKTLHEKQMAALQSQIDAHTSAKAANEAIAETERQRQAVGAQESERIALLKESIAESKRQGDALEEIARHLHNIASQHGKYEVE